MEGFEIKGSKRIPDMECIIGFSASLNEVGFAAKSVEVSREIIDSMAGRGVFF